MPPGRFPVRFGAIRGDLGQRCENRHRRPGPAAYRFREPLSTVTQITGVYRVETAEDGHSGPRGDRPHSLPATERSANSWSVRAIWAAATFSSRCATDEVPGIGTITGERRNSHARAI